MSATTTASATKKVIAILGRRLEIEPAEISPTSRLVEDLGMDSVNAAEILVDLEDGFDIEFGLGAVDELAQAQTVGDLAASVASRLPKGSATGDG